MKNRVVVVGVGALGSHFALLARNWENPLRIVDFDRVETKNCMSQFHTKMGLRKNKAQALKQALQGMFPVAGDSNGTKVEAVPHRLTADNAGKLLGDAALVVDCTDNAEARRLIRDQVRKEKTPCLHGALSGDGSFARIVWDEHFVADEEDQEGEATCENGAQLPFFALAAAQLAVEAQRFLKNGDRRCFQVTASGAVRLA